MKALLLAGAAALGWAATAHAAPLTATYDLTTTFSTGPNPAISISISLTYDTAAAAPVTVNNFASPVLGAYAPVTAYRTAEGVIHFGNTVDQNGAAFVATGLNQFVDQFSTSSTGAVTSTGDLSYSIANTNALYTSRVQVVIPGPAATSVPEPGSLALLAASVAGVAATRRRRPR